MGDCRWGSYIKSYSKRGEDNGEVKKEEKKYAQLTLKMALTLVIAIAISVIVFSCNHTWASRGVLDPKIRIGPKGYCRQKKRRQAKKSQYEFVYESEIRNRSQIRIRIYVLDVFAVKIRIGPLIFLPIRRIRGGGTVPPLPKYGCN
jgi:hypothetical protein